MARGRSGMRHRRESKQANKGHGPVQTPYGDTPYNIVKIEDKRAVGISSLSTLLTGVNTFLLIAYVGLLAWDVVEAKGDSFLPPIAASLFAIAQAFDSASPITEGLWRILVGVLRRRTPRPKLRILGKDVPGVDVFVVSCGEDSDIVLDTIKAVCNIDWPAHRFRVIHADDAGDPVLDLEVRRLQKNHPNLYRYARYKPSGKPHGYKSGNINTAMQLFVKNLPGGPNEYLAVIDADMLPEPQILRALVPHAVVDKNVGMVTVAQHFYNIPDNDPLYQSTITGPNCDDGLRDSVGAAWCPGCGFIMRYDAYEAIGGFPEFSIVEDLITSWLLHGEGWTVVLLHEVMQWGLQPDSILNHVKQRRRWWTGHVGFTVEMGPSLLYSRFRGASIVQRMAMILHSLRPWMNTVCKLLNLLLIAAALAFGGPVVAAPDFHALFRVVALVAAMRVLGVIGDIRAAFVSGNFLSQRRRQATNTWLGLHYTRDVLKAALPDKLRSTPNPEFLVSGVDEANELQIKERYPAYRHDIRTRMYHLHDREGFLYYLCLVGAMLLLVLTSHLRVEIGSGVHGRMVHDDAYWMRVISTTGFPGLGLIETLPLYLTPLVYILYPPTMPGRRDSMELDRNGKTPAWRPRKQYKSIKWTCAS